MLLASLRESHGMCVAIFRDLLVSLKTVVEPCLLLDYFFRPYVMVEQRLAFFGCFGCVDVVFAELQNFVIDVDN